MILQADLLVAFIVVFALDSIAPGPAVALVMSRGASIGFVRTLPLIAGLVLGDLFLFALALLGLAALAAALGTYFVVIKWIGIGYLLYLAYRLWYDSVGDLKTRNVRGEGWRSFGLGIVLPLGNPKAVGFYAALLPTVMDVSGLSHTMIVKFGFSIVIIWGVVLSGYTLMASIGRRRFASTSMQIWLNRGAAGAMVGVAGVMASRD